MSCFSKLGESKIQLILKNTYNHISYSIIFIFVQIRLILIQLTTKIKIALVTVTLSDGGAERVAAALSKYFDEHEYEVHHIVFSGKIEYDYNGVVHHLINSSKNKIINKCKRFIKLISIFRNNKFDYVIDFRTKELFWQNLCYTVLFLQRASKPFIVLMLRHI